MQLSLPEKQKDRVQVKGFVEFQNGKHTREMTFALQ
jgi:hypothetical protein